MPLPQSTNHITKLQTATGYRDILDLQLTGPDVQKTPSQTPISKCPAHIIIGWCCSLTGPGFCHPSSPAQPMEEEGEVSDQDTAMPEQELD